jgi:hypothetical protein
MAEIYSYERIGTPEKLRQLLLRESSLQREFKSARTGLLEDLSAERLDGAKRLKIALYVDRRGAHSKVVRLA